jgi:uncharacterized protein YukE
MGFLLPDPDALRAIADRIQLYAVVTRARGGRLRGYLHGLDWHGAAASAFHAEAAVALGALGFAADRLDSAADALRRHADNVGAVRYALTHLLDDAEAVTELTIDLGLDALGAVF